VHSCLNGALDNKDCCKEATNVQHGSQSVFGIGFIALLLGGCGGGSGNPPPVAVPAATTLSISAAVKTLNFSWTPSVGATTYRLLVDINGTSSFTEVGADIVAPSTTSAQFINVSELNWPSAQYRIDSCNASGCNSSASKGVSDLMLQAMGVLTASNGEISDHFAYALALSGDGKTLIVGATQHQIRAEVYVFTLTGGTWVQQTIISDPTPLNGGQFGFAVAISADGNTVAIGAPSESGGGHGINSDPTDPSAEYSGAAYVYTRSESQWSMQAYVKNSVDERSLAFGSSVALSASGDLLVAGAPNDDLCGTGVDPTGCTGGTDASGTVYSYRRTGTVWADDAYFKASNPDFSDYFGFAVAVSGDGNTMMVGAIFEAGGVGGINGDQSDNSVQQAGAAYVFGYANGAWTQQAYVKSQNPSAQGGFGCSGALSQDGSTLVIGECQNPSNASGVNGNSADTSLRAAGAAFIYTRTANAWTQQAYLKASNPVVAGRFGTSVALTSDGSTLLVGGIGDSSAAKGVDGDQADISIGQSGAAYLFRRAGSIWSQTSYLKPAADSVTGNFGVSAGVSNNGDTLAIGAAQTTPSDVTGTVTLF
jgi:trimeric autotransporter adhesin